MGPRNSPVISESAGKRDGFDLIPVNPDTSPLGGVNINPWLI